MLEALLLAMSCILTTNMVEYKNSAYHSIKTIECPKSSISFKLPYVTDDKSSGVRIASLSINLNSDNKTITINNEIEVERPWIAPIPIFMEVAKGKHNDKLAEELEKLFRREK